MPLTLFGGVVIVFLISNKTLTLVIADSTRESSLGDIYSLVHDRPFVPVENHL
jgi:hypothetical protein